MTSLRATDLRDRAAALHPSEAESRAWLLGEAKGWDDSLAWLGEDAQTEAAAEALYECDRAEWSEKWSRAAPRTRDHYRERARAAVGALALRGV